jgi:alkanesulfonate monooxygenase SsuD/methylene tetrahydromethanopterin reductase-like flavin-dependent oxidoreductase (luciferase family)
VALLDAMVAQADRGTARATLVSVEFHLFLPQMRMTMGQIVERCRAAEAAGFVGMAGMDHLAPPMAEDQPMYEAMVTNAWVAAHTEKLTVGSLVLCDSFRHPAMLAREAVSIDHASGGRFELGIGWGSVPTEFDVYGIGSTEPRARVQRLKETLEILRALWAGESLDYDGEFFHLRKARQEPAPTRRIPITIGGVGPKTLKLVADHADWWNLHTGALHRVQELRDQVGSARVSIQQMVSFIPSEAERAEITELATKRFGRNGPVIGNANELIDHYGRTREQGVERVYAWFTDFAKPETLAAFGETVIAQLA